MTKFRRLIAIRKLSTKDPRWIHKDVFRVLRKNELWQMAYENLKGNKGCFFETLGSEPGTMNQMSLQQLGKLREQVCTEQYKFKPVKLTHKPSWFQVFPTETLEPLSSLRDESGSFGTRVKTFGRERGSPRAPMSIKQEKESFFCFRATSRKRKV